MPLVSVIIPTYNGRNSIARTIRSVLQQSYKDFEILVVDDGFNDGTADVVKQFGNKVRYFYKTNGGRASARNYGIRNAKGTFIALLDHDDIWLPMRLEKQLKLIGNDPEIGLVYSDCYVKAEDGSRVPETSFKEAKPYEGYVFAKLFMRNFVPSLTTLIKKECFEKLGFFDESGRMMMTDDYHMWLRIATRYKFVYCSDPLAIHYRHSRNLSARLDQFVEEILWVLQDISERFPQQVAQLGLQRKKRIAELEYKLGKFYFQTKDERAQSWLLKAVRTAPFYWKAYLILAASLFQNKN